MKVSTLDIVECVLLHLQQGQLLGEEVRLGSMLDVGPWDRVNLGTSSCSLDFPVLLSLSPSLPASKSPIGWSTSDNIILDSRT